MSTKRAVVVAMSGGLDSSVTAMLMKQRGHHVIGVFMSNWDRADEAGSENEICPNDQDYEDAREVCDRLGIRELLKVSFQKEYWNDVFTPYVEDYANGLLTPNPDVDCNRHVKFNYLRHYVNAHIGTAPVHFPIVTTLIRMRRISCRRTHHRHGSLCEGRCAAPAGREGSRPAARPAPLVAG